MWHALRHHWTAYLAEAAGLAFFMVNAAWVTTLLEYPGSPVHQAIGSPIARRAVLGGAMFLVVLAIVYWPGGKRSGAHINPAVTWAFWRLGKMTSWDMAFYVAAQFAGAVAAGFAMKAVLGMPFAADMVKFATTRPSPTYGPWVAFAAEFSMTFVMMAAILVLLNSEKWEKRLGFVVAGLIAVYLLVETPLSGMSLNPARTFGSAASGMIWDGWWVYFTAPPLACLLAAEVFARWWRRPDAEYCPHLNHPAEGPCLFCAGDDVKSFPEQPGDDA